MMMIDKDRAYETIIGRKREKDGSVSESAMKPSENMAEGGEMDPRHEAAKDILMAMNEKHPGKLDEALRAHHDLHMMHKDKA